MIQPESQKASLAWFFNSPTVANFPQAIESPSLSNLHTNFTKVIDSIFSSVSDTLSTKETWITLGKECIEFESEFRKSFTSETGFALVKILKNLGSHLKSARKANPESMERLYDTYRSTLASLIIYAQDSKDFTFKKDVLTLVQQFETP